MTTAALWGLTPNIQYSKSGLTLSKQPEPCSPVSVLLPWSISIGGIHPNSDAETLQLLLHLLCCSYYRGFFI